MAKRDLSTAATEAVPSASSAPPLFIDTNLDTHLAMVVTPDDTVSDLKGKVSIEHAVCFPNIGDITVLSMKVRRRATFYHLSDSMLVKTAFDGTKGTWFLHMDVAPINNDGNALGGDTNKKEWVVTNDPSSVDGLIRADSSLKLTNPPLPDVSLLPCMSSGNQASRLERPFSVLLASETNCEALQKKSGAVKRSGESENSAPNRGNKSDVFDPESVGAVFERNGVSISHLQLAPDTLTDIMNRDVKDKDCANLIDVVDGGDTSTVAAEKEKSRKSGLTLEDACLLKSSSEKKRHNKEEGKHGSRKDHDKYLLQVCGTGDILPESMSRDHITENFGVLGEVASELPKDGSGIPWELLDDKKKRKKRRRKESDEVNTETDTFMHVKTIDSFENSTLRTRLSEHASKENDLSLEKKTDEENQKEAFPINDNYQKDDSSMPLEFLGDTKKKKKRRRKESNEFNNETDAINEEKPEEVPADGPKHLAAEPNMEIVPKEASRPRNAVETLPEAPPDDVKSLAHSKKRSGKARSSKVRSGKEGAFSSVADIPEKATVVSENFTEANSTAPLNKKSSSRSKKTLVQTKASCAETPCEEDTAITGPAGFAEQSLPDECAEAVNEIVTFEEALMPKTTQHGLVNSDHGHVIKESHKRKVQGGDNTNSDLVDPPKGPVTKHRNKSHKQKTAKTPQVMRQNDDGRGKSDMSHGDTFPYLPSLKSPKDNQISENHESFSGSELNKPTRLTEVKSSMDYLGTNAHIGQQKVGGIRDNSVKEVIANPATSSDSTEEDTPYNEKHYRVVVRKIIKSVLKNDSNKPNQEEIYLNTTDNISDHFTGTSSEDGHKENDTKKNVSDNLTSDDSEEDPEQIQFIRGPITQMKTSSQGMPSPSAHLHEKEVSNDDVPLSQTSNDTKKRIALGVLLRGSQSYRKAKLTAQSHADDTDSQPIEAVPETQPDSP